MPSARRRQYSFSEITGFYWQTFFEGDAKFDEDINGGSIVYDVDGVKLNTGGVAGDYAILWSINMNTYTLMSWDKKRTLEVGLYISSVWNKADFWATLGDGGERGATDEHIGVKTLNSKLYGTVANGTTESTLLLEDPYPTGAFTVKVVFIPNVECRFFINGVDRGAITTNLPSGSAKYHTTLCLQAKTTENGSIVMECAHWKVFQEE